jgi:hypothetical protein
MSLRLAILLLSGCGRLGIETHDASPHTVAPVDARDDSLRLHLAFAFSHEALGRPYRGDAGGENTIEIFATTGPVSWHAAGNNRGAMSTNFQPDTWQHLAATHDGATLRFYVDGVLAATTMFPLRYDLADTWLVGCDRNVAVYGDFADGALDEVRIYDRVLSDAEIAELAIQM